MGNYIGRPKSTTIHVTSKQNTPLEVSTDVASPELVPKKAPTMRTSKTFTFENVLPATPVTYVTTTSTEIIPELILDAAIHTRVSVSKIKLDSYVEPVVETVVEDNLSISSEESSVSEIEENHPCVIPETSVPQNSPVCDYTVQNTEEHTVLYKKMSHLML
jgi:hypothetical protein